MDQPITVCHVTYGLAHGGLERGLVNLLHALPTERYRHLVVPLTPGGALREALPAHVRVLDCPTRPGWDLRLQGRFWRLLRQWRPAVVHTRNLATLELQCAASLAGVPVRIHGEHGHDMHDLENRRARYRWLRRALASCITHWTAVSAPLADYLARDIGVAPGRITQLCNGVDCDRFQPRGDTTAGVFEGAPFTRAGRFVIGSVLRLQAVKDPRALVQAVARLVATWPHARRMLALVIVGDGPLRATLAQDVADHGLADLVWLPGAQADIPAWLQGFDLFAMPSLAEGIPNGVLEAMACGLPVVATAVGGTPSLVEPDVTGTLVPPADPQALAAALARYWQDPTLATRHGAAGRRRAVERFGLPAMVARYDALYSRLAA